MIFGEWVYAGFLLLTALVYRVMPARGQSANCWITPSVMA
jgi:hypothetical protein